MIDAIQTTRAFIRQSHRFSARTEARLSDYRTSSRVLIALIIAMAVDLFFPLPSILRGLFVLGAVGWIVRYLADRRLRLWSEPARLEQDARSIETRHPELENALINAIQFERSVTVRPADQSSGLMQQEMARAERLAGTLQVQDPAGLDRIAKERRFVVGVCGAIALSAVLFPRGYRFELPRFLFFWQDRPPFTLTDFKISPHGAHVKAGASVSVELKVEGEMPGSIDLVTQAEGKRPVSSPLFADESGKYSQTLENLNEDTLYWIQADTGRSDRYTITIDQAPRVKIVRATLKPPAYTRRSAETVTVDNDGIKGLFNTVVNIEVEANRAVESGKLLIASAGVPEEAIGLTPVPNQPNRLQGEFTIRRAGEYRVDLTAANGVSAKSARHGPIELLRDGKPIVYMTQPGSNAMITPTMRVPLHVEAEDDVAVQRIELHTIVNEAAESTRILPVKSGERHVEAQEILDFADLGARPGDVFQYYATAFDNEPGKPNLTDSDRYWIWVVSDEDYARILKQQRGMTQMVDQYRAQTEALADLAARQGDLARELDKLRKDTKSGADDLTHQSRLQSLQKQQELLYKDAANLAKEMKKLAAQEPQYAIERGLKQKLTNLAGQVEKAAQSMAGAANARSADRSADKSEEAARRLEKAAGQSRQTVDRALKALEAASPLYDDVAGLQQIKKKQTELSMQAKRMSEQPKSDEFSKSRLDSLRQDQSKLREELNRVQQDIQEHSEQCRTTCPAASQQGRSLAQAIDRLKVSESMRAAEQGFRESNASQGSEHAGAARRALESLFQQGKQCQGTAKQGLNSQCLTCLGRSAGSTLEQMSRMASGRKAGNSGQGQSGSMAQGNSPAPKPGSRPGDGGPQDAISRNAVALSLQQPQRTSSSRKENRNAMKGGELPVTLSPLDVERVGSTARAPSAAKDRDAGRYPVEYRRLVKDYFQAVAGGK